MRLKYNILTILFLFFISGCTTTEYLPTEVHLPVRKKQGVYHKVKKGETLWRVAKAYDVDIDRVISVNNIPNAAIVEENQLVFIPGVNAVKDVPAVVQQTKREGFQWPIKGNVLYYFGEKHKNVVNNGVGIKAYEGQVVRATRQGKIVFADYLSGYAETIIVDHGDQFFSVYSQNSKLLGKVGDQVNQGDAIAKVGKNGKSAYLHFEIRRKSKPKNPLYYLP